MTTPQQPYRQASNRRLDPYPGDEPCQCGAVTITGSFLSSAVGHADDLGMTVHYRASGDHTCEETP